jgi:hypothetical protein
MAPRQWWTAWESCAEAGDWKTSLRELTLDLTTRLSVKIAYTSLDVDLADLVFGTAETGASVPRPASVEDVEGLPNLSLGYDSYLNNLDATLRGYVDTHISPEELDPLHSAKEQRPVFTVDHAERNLLLPDPKAHPGMDRRVIDQIAVEERHRWFRSTHSSQALTQSVFGSLISFDRIELLGSLESDEGLPAVGAVASGAIATLEKKVGWLGELEPRVTSVDVWLENGPLRVAIECKLTEQVVGMCSRPRLEPSDPNHCDGSYAFQHNRTHRCSLAEAGVTYWDHIPDVFNWDPFTDANPCPMSSTYQIVRNVLASAVTSAGVIDLEHGHALVVYDRRNPCFAPGGPGYTAIRTVQEALKFPDALRTVSWQAIVGLLAGASELHWLVESLAARYGISAVR